MRRILPLLTPLILMGSEESIAKSLEVWSLMSFVELALLLLIVGYVMHLAGRYYKNIMGKFRIKLSGENWAVVFLLVRDLSLFLAFVIGLFFINPDIMADIKLAVPFIPLGTFFIGVALLIKLNWDIDENRKAFGWFTAVLTLAVILQYFGFTFVMEAAPTEWLDRVSPIWATFRNMRSNVNPELSMATFYIVFPLIVLLFIAMIISAFRKKND